MVEKEIKKATLSICGWENMQIQVLLILLVRVEGSQRTFRVHEMVRTRATGQGGRPPVPPAMATRGRGCGCGRGRGRAARATPADPPATPVQDQVPVMDAPAAPAQAPAVPIMIPGLQEVLAQILSVCTGLAQAVSATIIAATSQAGGDNQTPAACIPEQVVHKLQMPGAHLA